MPYVLDIGRAKIRVDVIGCVGCGAAPKTTEQFIAGSQAGTIAVKIGSSRQIAVPLWRCADCYKKHRSATARQAQRRLGAAGAVTLPAIALLLAVLFTAGCPALDGTVLPRAKRYFPAAEIHHYHAQFLHIETRVSNVAPPFVAETWQSFAAKPEFAQLRDGMRLSGYRFLVLGFQDYNVLWDSAAPAYIAVMDRRQWLDWWTRSIGPPPDPAAIQVVR